MMETWTMIVPVKEIMVKSGAKDVLKERVKKPEVSGKTTCSTRSIVWMTDENISRVRALAI